MGGKVIFTGVSPAEGKAEFQGNIRHQGRSFGSSSLG